MMKSLLVALALLATPPALGQTTTAGPLTLPAAANDAAIEPADMPALTKTERLADRSWVYHYAFRAPDGSDAVWVDRISPGDLVERHEEKCDPARPCPNANISPPTLIEPGTSPCSARTPCANATFNKHHRLIDPGSIPCPKEHPCDNAAFSPGIVMDPGTASIETRVQSEMDAGAWSGKRAAAIKKWFGTSSSPPQNAHGPVR